jgi:hypothetical protein
MQRKHMRIEDALSICLRYVHWCFIPATSTKFTAVKTNNNGRHTGQLFSSAH